MAPAFTLSRAERELINLLRDDAGPDFSIGISRGICPDGTKQFTIMLIRPLDPPPVGKDIGIGDSFESGWLARSGR